MDKGPIPGVTFTTSVILFEIRDREFQLVFAGIKRNLEIASRRRGSFLDDLVAPINFDPNPSRMLPVESITRPLTCVDDVTCAD